jgi:hypothetical protein
MKKNIHEIFGNQLSKLLSGVDGHDPIIIQEAHDYLKKIVEDFLKKNKLEEKYIIKTEYDNVLTYSKLKSDISIVDTKTNKTILAIEYSSARTSFVKNKSNNAANLVSELYNYVTAEVPILWIFNTVSLCLEKLDRYNEYKDDLKLFLDGKAVRPKLKNEKSSLTVDQLNESHFSSLYKIDEMLNKNNSISEVLLTIIDFDYDKKIGLKSNFQNFNKSSKITEWLKDSTDNFEEKIDIFLKKILIEKEKDSKSVLQKIKNFLKNFKIIPFGG